MTSSGNVARRALGFMGLMLLSGSFGAQLAASQERTPAVPAMSVENRALARRAGHWDATFTSWAKPGAPPEVTTGLIADRRMYGEMLQEVLRPGPAARVPAFVRIDDLTFNRLEGRWDYVSMDSRVPYGLLMPAWSLEHDVPGHIFLSFEPFALPGANGSGVMTRMQEIVIAQDADHEVKDQYFTPAGGVKWLAKRYSYVRRP
jgi:hypothetical protein